jgi:uncharacterized protein
MKEKIFRYTEILFVYIVILLIAAFSGLIVSLGGSTPVKMILSLLIYVAMAAVPFIICRLKKISLSQLGYSKNNIGKQILIAICIFAVTISFTVVIPLLIGMNKNDVLNFKCSSVGILIFYIIYDFLFVGFGEEFIFRGYFYNALGTVTKSQLAGVILSSILFGLMHYPNSHNILQVIVTTAIGLLYGFARYKIKNCTLLSVSVAHGLQDTVIIILSYFLL